MTSKYLPILLAALIALIAAGCSTTESATNGAAKKSETIAIEKGMSAEDLIAALGEPAEVRDVDPPSDNVKIWVYEQRKQSVKLTTTGTKETPYWNPITGEYSPIQDVTYGQERETLELVTEFLIGEGVVLGWRQEANRDSQISE